MKNQTLFEFVKEVPADQVIKVGCKEGTSYVIACKQSEFTDEIIEADERQKTLLLRADMNARNELRNLLDERCPSLRSYVINLNFRDEDDSQYSFDAYVAYVNNWFRGVLQAQKRAKQTTKEREEFIPFEDRKVVESFKADPVIGDELAIMIEGSGNGRYWDYSEALAEKEKRGSYESEACRDETETEGE